MRELIAIRLPGEDTLGCSSQAHMHPLSELKSAEMPGLILKRQ